MAPKPYTIQFHNNFIRAVKYAMADREFDYNKEVAEWLGVSAMTMHNIMDKKQAPTIEQGVTLCKKGEFNANWLFCNQGEMKLETQNSLNEIVKLLTSQHA